jgi:hypothetical protein
MSDNDHTTEEVTTTSATEASTRDSGAHVNALLNSAGDE